MKILLKQATCFISNKQLVKDVLIDDRVIAEISDHIVDDTARIIDCQGFLLTPGFIDLHVHLREPGGEEKETIRSGTEAAARGGFTTIAAMPNTNPVPDNSETLARIFKTIKTDAVVRVLPYAAITTDLQGETLTDMTALSAAGAFAFTDDGVGIQTADVMLRAMQQAVEHGKAIVAHCEDNSLIYGGVLHQGKVSERLNLPGIPSTCEAVQIARDVLLAEQTGCHYHVCHVSTKESVRIIRDAKRAGVNVTAEVTPHHLILTEDDILEDDANFKMNPPLRSKSDQLALIAGLQDGTIDFIATDHAPHTADEKRTGFLQAPFGIVGLETAFSLLYTHLVQKEIITLKQLVDFMTIIPAQLFSLPYGKLAENEVADLTLIDLNKTEEIDQARFYSKSTNTPFNGWHVAGIPVLTLVEGRIIFDQVTKKAKERVDPK